MTKGIYDSIQKRLALEIPLFADSILEKALTRLGTNPSDATAFELKKAIEKYVEPVLLEKLGVRKTFGELGSGICTLDSSGKIKSISLAASRLVPDIRKKKFTIGTDVQIEIIDSGESQVKLVIIPSINENKEMDGGVCLISDISFERALEKEIELTYEKASAILKETQQKLLKLERLAAIGELAGMVGHDLRNPLQAIQNAAYFLKTGFDGNSKNEATGVDNIKKMIDVIEKNVEYSNKIVNDLLDYSREIRLELTQVTPKMIIQETLSTMKIPEAVKVKNLVQDTPRIELDPVKIRRVFFNLVKNAIDSIPERGELIMSSNRADHHVDFVFTDTGTGMSQEIMKRLWTPLFTTKARGMGFGLPICKRYVEAHGGKILVTSKVGEGTTFTVRLPIEQRANQRENPSDHQ
jgi:signal transduction histidine kinase